MTRAIFSTLAGAALLVAVSAAPEYKAPETTCTDPPKATYPAKHGNGYPAEYPASAKYPASKVYPVSKSYPAGYPKDPYPTTSTCTEEGSYPTDTYVKYPASTYTPSKEYPASYPAEYPSSSTTCTDEYPATYTGGAIPTGYTTKVVYSTSAYPTSTCTYDAYNSSYCTTTSAYSSYAVATTLCPVEEAYPTSTAYPIYTTSTIYSTSCYDVTTTDEYKKEKTYKTTEYVPVSTTVCTVEETYPATHAGESYPKATYTAQPVGGSKPESYPAAGNATCTGYGCATGTAAYGSKPTYAVSAGALVSAAPALAAAAALSLFMGLMA